MERYCVMPDEWKDYPHHTRGRNSRRIVRRVTRAREEYIRGNDGDAAAELGLAFHYLADEYVLLRGSQKNAHAAYESKISRATIYVQFADELNGKNTTLGYISGKMKELSSMRFLLTPEEALNSSYEVCLSVAKSVFGSKISPKLESDLLTLRNCYLEKMRIREEEFVSKLWETEKKDEAFARLEGFDRIERRLLRFFTFFDFRFKRNIKCYKEKKQFTGLVKSYYGEASQTCYPYHDWYKVGTPQLSIWAKEVKPKLISLDSIVEEFKLNEEKIRELKKILVLSTIKLKGEEFINGEALQKVIDLISPTPKKDGKQNLKANKGKEKHALEILPCETLVKGIFYDNRQEVAQKAKVNETVNLVRDYQNKFDHNAIKVWLGNEELGFIPRDLAQLLAPEMDCGLTMKGTITEVVSGNTPKIKIKIEAEE